ncbi:hypothetical protein [Allosalinactinospora lopnorensis]|uniref:hypothetical protein n=1 Tax=Allosalinactinospora lopnorensis TaxID=1352348 RepID=UPI00138F0304|nr:hypothetical protein [Allosalinactinospora lopnorensis]
MSAEPAQIEGRFLEIVAGLEEPAPATAKLQPYEDPMEYPVPEREDTGAEEGEREEPEGDKGRSADR